MQLGKHRLALLSRFRCEFDSGTRNKLLFHSVLTDQSSWASENLKVSRKWVRTSSSACNFKFDYRTDLDFYRLPLARQNKIRTLRVLQAR